MSDSHEVFLDTIPLVSSSVGYGELGLRGSLGYENQHVVVGGQRCPRALSAHAPSRLVYSLPPHASTFHSRVALNDDVPLGSSAADFVVRADGRPIAVVPCIAAGDAPFEIEADVTGARVLELSVETDRWESCHAVWLDPRVIRATVASRPAVLVDCLRRAEISLPSPRPRAKRCIATVVSPGFELLLDDMLGSLVANARCEEALMAVFALGANEACRRVVNKYGALMIECSPKATVSPASKAVLYTVARVIDADYFLCLDADMLVLDDLRPVFAALEACPPGSIFACREGNGVGWHKFDTLGHALTTAYGGCSSDLRRLLVNTEGAGAYSFVVNDGLFAGSRRALLGLDSAVRAMPGVVEWVDEREDIRWRNQFVFNAALAKLDNGVELDPVYNVQLISQEASLEVSRGRLRAKWRDRNVSILHFNGLGRNKYSEWKQHFARIHQPMKNQGGVDSYDALLTALRGWVGRHGLNALTWSFYGAPDGIHAHVPDSLTMPLLAALYSLVRSNGCVRILESGTGRGVSTACLASAVAHREEGRVVTFDPHVLPEREDLFRALPPQIRRCIEPRTTDGLQGMAAAIGAGESYEAALLDSVHTAEHVWQEFQLAAQLVCPGGLILIHDAVYAAGSVATALEWIEEAGYGVVRLWTADSGVKEDNHLGLALVENRRRERSRKSIQTPGETELTHRKEPETGRAAGKTAAPPRPLISCVMPTGGRAALARQSLKYFQSQTYRHVEIIVLDDGDDGLSNLLPSDDRVQYVRTEPGLSIGAKRNRGCQLARGEIIAQWDDDDWYSPTRLEEQVLPLLTDKADVTGLTSTIFFDLPRWRFLTCSNALHEKMFVYDVHGGTLVFRRHVWRRLARYPDASLAEDAEFLKQAVAGGARLANLSNNGLFVYLRHDSNSWSFACGQSRDAGAWREIPKDVMPSDDLDFYACLLSERLAPDRRPR